jgi:hypothetical protein
VRASALKAAPGTLCSAVPRSSEFAAKSNSFRVPSTSPRICANYPHACRVLSPPLWYDWPQGRDGGLDARENETSLRVNRIWPSALLGILLDETLYVETDRTFASEGLVCCPSTRRVECAIMSSSATEDLREKRSAVACRLAPSLKDGDEWLTCLGRHQDTLYLSVLELHLQCRWGPGVTFVW